MTRRSIFFKSQVNPFVLLFVERAGSTYLTSLLNSHPDVLALREQFDVLKQAGKGTEAQLAWARELLTPPLIGRNRARGFKTKFDTALVDLNHRHHDIVSQSHFLVQFSCQYQHGRTSSNFLDYPSRQNT